MGTTANVAGTDFQVMKVQQENEGLTLVIQIKRELMENMKEIRFYTPDGNPLEIWGQGSFTFGNASQMEYNLDLPSIPKTLNVEIDLWKNLETINVPFEIASGLGFGG